MTDLLARLEAALGDAYKVERELGGGGMSRVFAATEVELGRHVVIKVLPPEVAAGVNLDRFRREIQLAASLQHPHIVPLLTAGHLQELLYYTMPLIEGESLRAKVAREGALPINDTVRIMRDVVDALAYAHRHGVVHRDIKPDNVLISDHHAVVTDFGVAKALSESTGQSSLTSAGVALGTPAYMAPEQAAADPHADHRCDIYAVGALAYEMLTGRPPFTGGTPQQVLAAQVSEAPVPVAKHRATVPPALAEMVMRCLEKNPADRWPSAEELLHQLEAMSTPSGGTQPVSLAWRWSHGPLAWTRWALVAGIGLLLLGFAIAEWRRLPSRRGAAAAVATAGAPYAASVAVLPFDNLGGGPEDEYFSQGITDEIITQLAQVPRLKVISRTSVVALQGSRLTLPQIADTLGVRDVLEGSVRRVGKRIRVDVQLIEAKTDAHLWAQSYDRELTDVFSVQQEIARQVSTALIRAVGALPPANTGSRTGQVPAYEAYLRGKYWIHSRTAQGLERAIQAFQEAVRIDSGYAPAYAGLASAYGLWVTYEYLGLDHYAAAGKALAMANRAIALDPNLADGYAARGYVRRYAWASAEEDLADLKRALELEPNSADVHGWYAHILAREGRFDEALAEHEQSIALDPLGPGRHIGYAWDALAARRYDLAVREARATRALEPGLMEPRAAEALGHLLLGEPERCTEMDLGTHQGVYAVCLVAIGQRARAAAIVDSLRTVLQSGARDSTVNPVSITSDLSDYYAWLGDARGALEWLRRAHELSPLDHQYRVVMSAVFDRVRSDPRFESGLKQMREAVWARVRRESERVAKR